MHLWQWRRVLGADLVAAEARARVVLELAPVQAVLGRVQVPVPVPGLAVRLAVAPALVRPVLAPPQRPARRHPAQATRAAPIPRRRTVTPTTPTARPAPPAARVR
ncbi:hypothetical protein DC415_22960 [Agrobacterium tumefaciens]|uniref:Uncharacterized protein n=1 Tax=Rhizobium rhizogenes TaxID=359 RepID=A0AA92BZD6_RHIRH|nr:hypothetical protein DC430_21825 [Rhizobium rhizogenes]PVE62172.1 hypothetical protein DC415_22960 [Agrobacterium tumefaciens]PVE70353.1 hypothetical protein DCP16_22960 [Sphingomonas sp. TPD3009]